MKVNKGTLGTVILASTILISSCEAVKNTNRTQRGAAIGAVSGAVIGGVLGNNIGKGGKGALGAVIGGVVGGVAGGLIGNKMDKQARQIQEQLPGAKVERVGEGIKAKHTLSGYVLKVANSTPNSFQLIDRISVGNKPTEVVYQFSRM